MCRRREHTRLKASKVAARVARVLDETVQLFEGNAAAARRWFETPKKALRGASPLECARTEAGARRVEAMIGRLRDGVFL
jgi:putative toxin-antitoxin system antitoxin component (TIGR02293 family)